MSLSLKVKLTGLIAVLVLAVVVVTSALYGRALIRQALEDVAGRAQDVARQVYDQSREVLGESRMPLGLDPGNPNDLRIFARDTLNADPRLLSSIQSATTFSQSLEYVSLTDADGLVILHNNPNEVGHRLMQAPPFSSLSKASLRSQLASIFGPPRIYEVVFPLSFGPVALDVRIGISTVLIAARVKPQLSAAFWTSSAAVLLSTLTAALLSFLLLRPFESISLNMDRLARGELTAPVPVSRSDEWGILTSKLNLLGERIRGEKAAFVALKENLDQLLANLADGLMFFDQQDRLVLATPAVARFLGKPAGDLLRRTPSEVFSSADPLGQFLRDSFTKRQAASGRTLDGQGETRRVAVSVVFVEEKGTPVASLVTLRDAETRAQLEDQIDTAAKLAAIGRLTSGVAHEVKNPLNAMVLQLEILKAKLQGQGQGEAVMPHVEILTSEIRRLDRVVRTFLDFARPVELHPAETDLEGLVEDVFRMAEPEAMRRQVKLVLERNGSAKVRVDRDLMKQALLNLVLNGCQAMPAGGELRVSSHACKQGVQLEVADQGTGIPPEARSKIFSLYYTTKPSGTGVGLAMTFRIVQLHNGSIDFSSEPNRGTTFRVTLPV